MMETTESRFRQLVLRGLMPSDAEAIVRDTDARNGELLNPSEAELLAVQTEATAEADKVWVMYSVDVPDQYRRIWFARTIE